MLQHWFKKSLPKDDADGGVPYELNPAKNRAQSVKLTYRNPENTYIEVFWKDFRGAGPVDRVLSQGVGPVLSLIVAGYEVARFDCLGEPGHFHVVLVRPEADAEIRLWFRETGQAEQVRRSAFELQRNIGYYIKRNPMSAVRDARIDQEEHLELCRKAEEMAIGMCSENGIDC